MIQLDVELSVMQYDLKAIERQFAAAKLKHSGWGLGKLRYKPVFEMKCKVNNITPYVININDLELTKFKVAKKRVLIYPFDFTLVMNSFVAPA